MNTTEQKDLIKYIFLNKTKKEPCKQRNIEPILFLATKFGLPLSDLYFEFSDYAGIIIPCFSKYLLESFGKNVKSFEKEENNRYFYYFDFLNKGEEIKKLKNKIKNFKKVNNYLNFLNKIKDDKTLAGLAYKLYLLSQGKNNEETENCLKDNFNITNFKEISNLEKKLRNY